jgi:hypothetical protein
MHSIYVIGESSSTKVFPYNIFTYCSVGTRTRTECSRWPSLLWTEWRARVMLYHAHALNVRFDLGGPVAALDGMKSEAVSTGRWAYRFVLMVVTRRGHSSSQLASGLAESHSLMMQAGCHLFLPLSNVVGSLPWRSGMSVSYTLPTSRTRPNAARRCCPPRWLARQQDSRRLAVCGKTTLWEVPTAPFIE